MFQMKLTFSTGHLSLHVHVFLTSANETNLFKKFKINTVPLGGVQEGRGALHRIPQLFNHWNKTTIHVLLSGAHKHGENQLHFIL